MKWHIGIYFLAFFFLYLFLGLWGSGFNSRIYTEYDLFYDIDSNLQFELMYMRDLTNLDRHPFVFWLLPFLKAIQFLGHIGEKEAVLLLQALVGSLNNILLLSILKKINVKPFMALLFMLIYAFSFSTLLFVSFPEIYVYSALIGLIFLYTILVMTENKREANLWHLFLLSLLVCCGTGVNLINFVLYLPLLYYCFLKQGQGILKKICIFLSMTVCTGFVFLLVGEILWGTFEFLLSGGKLTSYKAIEWFHLPRNNLLQVFQETWIAPFYALDTIFVKKIQRWCFLAGQDMLWFIPFFVFVGFSKCYRYIKKTSQIIWFLLGTIILHTFLNCFYNDTWFLYSQNYFFYIIVCLAFFYSQTNNKSAILILAMFLCFQIFMNLNVISIFMEWINQDVPVNFIAIVPNIVKILILVILGFSAFLSYFLRPKTKDK